MSTVRRRRWPATRCPSTKSTPARPPCGHRPQTAALPRPGTSEGRQLRRWLTQLLVTERVMAAEAAALGVTVTDSTPTEEQLLPDLTARLEIGSIAAGALADPLARAVFAHVTADVDVDAETVADYHRRNPDRFAGQAEPEVAIAAMLRGAARRRAFRLWLDQRRAALVGWPPAMSIPATPVSPTTSTGTEMPAPSLALDIGGTKIAAGLIDANGQVLHQNRQPTPRSADPDRCGPPPNAPSPTRSPPPAGRWTGWASPRPDPSTSADGTISPVNIGAWRGFPVRDRVAAAVPGVPVRLAGDGLCMALGEHWRGAGAGRGVHARHGGLHRYRRRPGARRRAV